MIKVIATVALGLSLVACGDKPQVVTGKGVKNDAAPHTGVGGSACLCRHRCSGMPTGRKARCRHLLPSMSAA